MVLVDRLIASPAFAAPVGAEDTIQGSFWTERMMKSMDKNKDGSISKDEAKGTPHEKDFAKLDKDKDGKLSRAEHAAAPEHAGGDTKKGGAGGSTSKGY